MKITEKNNNEKLCPVCKNFTIKGMQRHCSACHMIYDEAGGDVKRARNLYKQYEKSWK